MQKILNITGLLFDFLKIFYTFEAVNTMGVSPIVTCLLLRKLASYIILYQELYQLYQECCDCGLGLVG